MEVFCKEIEAMIEETKTALVSTTHMRATKKKGAKEEFK